MWDQDKYRREHKDLYARLQANSRKRNPRKHLVIDARARAKRYGVPADITEKDIQWVTHCPALGVELIYGRTGGDGRRANSATLDRRDNTKGYVKGNVFVLSHRANRIKSDATIAELEAILQFMCSK